jgi:hypothetical protein
METRRVTFHCGGSRCPPEESIVANQNPPWSSILAMLVIALGAIGLVVVAIIAIRWALTVAI